VRRRFFVQQFHGNSAVIEGDTAHHLGRVLRAQRGQLYELSDGECVWLARIERVARNRVEFVFVEEIAAYLPTVDLRLLLSVVKFDSFEWALEKATELGVATIVPMAVERSGKALLSAAKKRSERWQKLLVEASQQSRRVRVPALEPLRLPDDAFLDQRPGLRLLLSERSDAPLLRAALSGVPVKSATVAVGPEGGWTDRELELARQAGFQQVSLGKLVLRAETAVVAALAIVQFALE
jgi:16S rRNA (uracil1498-N3)-methyltransferase